MDAEEVYATIVRAGLYAAVRLQFRHAVRQRTLASTHNALALPQFPAVKPRLARTV